MIDARIDRVCSDVMGTFGRLVTSSGFRAVTIEPQWLDNAPGISCIPPGDYLVEWSHSTRFGRGMYLVRDVTGRSGIRIHPGNIAGTESHGLISHFQGCIGLGTRLGVLQRQRAVLASAPAVLAFERHMQRQPFRLLVT